MQRWEEAEKFDRNAPAVWVEGPFGHAYYWRDARLWAAPLFAKGGPVPFDLSTGAQVLVDDFSTPLTASQRSAVETALTVAALMPGT